MAQQELKIIVKADGTATVTRQLDGVTQAANKASAAGKKLSLGKEFMGGMVTGALTAAAAYMSVRAALRLAGDALENFNNATMTIKQVQATLNSTGRAAEFTTEQLGQMASALQQVSNYGDEEILTGATMGLLRFDSISKEMFPRVQRLAVDMAESMGGLENATRTLGISIADPILGMTRLRRAGVMLNQDQQDLIKSLVETGKTAEAQGVLLTALESKYGGLAMAGVTASAQLKNAWGDYLETIGGSISAFDGVKKGMAQFFTGVAANSDALSKTQMKHIFDVQEQWAIFTAKAMEYAKVALTYFGGLVKGFVGGLIGVGKVAWGALIDIFEPDIMKSPLQKALADLKKNGDDWAANWDSISGNFKNTNNENVKSIEAFYDAQRKLVDSGINPFTNAEIGDDDEANKIKAKIDEAQKAQTAATYTQTADLLSAWSTYYTALDQYSNESIEHQANLYKYQLQQQYGTILSMQQIDEMYNAKLWELRDKQLAHFAENNEAMPERLGDTIGNMLSAWSTYYTALDQYSNESIQAQADLYKNQLQQQYGTILSMTQIDEMYNAKLGDLRGAQLAHFAEVNAQMPEIAKTAYQKMQDYAKSMAANLGDQAFNVLENSIYSLMAETKSLKDVWKNAWAAMEDIALRAMADIIVQTLRTIKIQLLLKSIMGIFTKGGSVLGAGAGDLPSVPIASVNTGMGSLPTGGNSNSELLMAITGLRSELSRNANPNFTLQLDGKELHHGLKRVESRLNYMGSGV